MNKILKKQVRNFISKAEEGNAPRTLVVKISTPTPDRSDDTVAPMGGDFTNFLKNPVVLFAHDYSSIPVAKATSIKATDTGIIASLQFPDEGLNPNADVVYNMNKEGFLNAWSIGFNPSDYSINDAGGHDFTKWELLEFSSVPVPDNPEALTIMRSKGFNDGEVAKDSEEVEIKDFEITMNFKSIGDLKGVLEAASASIGVLKLENDQLKKEIERLKSVDDTTIKSGRAISARHETMLKECADYMQKSMDNIKTILTTVSSDEEEPMDGDGSEKALTIGVLKGIQKALREQDKTTGLALKKLKLALSAEGGEK